MIQPFSELWQAAQSTISKLWKIIITFMYPFRTFFLLIMFFDHAPASD